MFVEAVVIVAAFGSFTGLVYHLTRKKLSRQVQEAQGKSSNLLEKAREERQSILGKAKQQVNELLVEGRDIQTAEQQAVEEELHENELRLEKETQRVDTVRNRLLQREKVVNSRFEALENRQGAIRQLHQERTALSRSEVSILEESLGISKEMLMEGISKRFIDMATNEAQQILRQTAEIAESEYAPLAKRVMGIAIGRIGQTKVKERPQVSVTGTPKAFADLLEAVGGERDALDTFFGLPLVISEDEDLVTVRFDTLDTVKREVVRRVLEKTFVVGKIPKDLKNLFEKRMEEMENELVGLGRRAFKLTGLKPKVDKEIVKLIGRLYYRTSYTQNQWLHSVEASQIAGLMAHELKLDVQLAKRAALLHDIGKALTHEIEGSHAVIGAGIAEKCGEDPLIVNAIGAHHGDVPEESLYARIV
ncbi:DUF3552 domain-containing protein, partial [Myxococcota bacterium]|nr:DUF3552 domain-containing protein [Myxococcota bacterium]MBU1534392.1 DUF3552 domain-containing protein [Myxococcota bacterium]